MHHLPPLVGQDHQHAQKLIRHCGHRKAIQSTRDLNGVFQAGCPVGDGGLRGRSPDFSTVNVATVTPSVCNSLTMRGEPQVGWDRHMSRISSRTSWAKAGRPG
jgi:hypothetical protein